MDFAVTGIVPHLAELPGAYRLAAPLFWWRYYKQEPKTKITTNEAQVNIIDLLMAHFHKRSHFLVKFVLAIT